MTPPPTACKTPSASPRRTLAVCANPTNSGRGCTRSPDITRCAVFGIATAKRSPTLCPTSHRTKPARTSTAGQSELARLVAEAAGGLSDRDRELLELSYRHGLDGPELAEALGVTLTSANTMVFRLRQTVERCLGALLVARGARADRNACPELVAILEGWDGQLTVLMRKRIARHIESCHTCAQEQRRHVNPVALLGGAPVFIPAPEWLRGKTLDRVQADFRQARAPPTRPAIPAGPAVSGARVALLAGVPLICLGRGDRLVRAPRHPDRAGGRDRN